MRQCIFCGQLKKDSEFNKEHIILYSLGGKGNEDICRNVCISCNSSLGTRVDACLINHEITKCLRYFLKIRGRNGVPNPFKNVKVNYDDTIFTGELQTDGRGNLTGFRADYKTYEVDSKIIIAGPRKGFSKYVNSQLKEKNFSLLSEEDISKNTLHIKNPKVPRLDKIKFQESEMSNYLYFAYPAMLKMAYEFCFVKLGEHYLDDSSAIDIREFLMKFDYRKCSEYFSPTDAELKWTDDNQTRIVSLEIYRKCNELYVNVDLYRKIIGVLCMSKSANKYGEVKTSALQVET